MDPTDSDNDIEKTNEKSIGENHHSHTNNVTKSDIKEDPQSEKEYLIDVTDNIINGENDKVNDDVTMYNMASTLIMIQKKRAKKYISIVCHNKRCELVLRDSIKKDLENYTYNIIKATYNIILGMKTDASLYMARAGESITQILEKLTKVDILCVSSKPITKVVDTYMKTLDIYYEKFGQ